jgi:hypothetical protein
MVWYLGKHMNKFNFDLIIKNNNMATLQVCEE